MKIPCRIVIAATCVAVISASAQTSPPAPPSSSASVQSQIDEIRGTVLQLREELAASRREVAALLAQMPATRVDSPGVPVAEPLPTLAPTLDEDQQLLAAKVDDQYQTKVASGSRYRLQLSGMLLFNAFSTRGAVDNADLPGQAQNRAPGDSAGSFGASARQTQLSLHLSGPDLAGARTSADVSGDFFGGFPATPEGVTAGLARLRTARIALDWDNASVVAAQEAPFFSPFSPSSLVSTAYPALGGAGNLWTWTPQIYAMRRVRVTERSTLSLTVGLLDALSGESPSGEYYRAVTAGETSRSPAYAAHIGWRHTAGGSGAAVGIGGYFSPQNWGFGRTIDAWAATADWDIPLGRTISVSGELYRGQAIAGLGGGRAPSVFFSGVAADATSLVTPAESAGGWSQIKWRPLPKIEFNAAYGGDQVFHSGLFRFPFAAGNGPVMRRNSSAFINGIYQPRSNLLFSIEYRKLWTLPFGETAAHASQIGVAAGVIF